MKVIFDDGKEIEFDENEVGTLQDHRERIFKKDGIWYITKIINKDLAKWLDETKPMIIEEKKIPEKINNGYTKQSIEDMKEARFNSNDMAKICNRIGWLMENRNELSNKIDEIIDYLQSKGDE